jgi:hypothetical protein
MTSASEHRRIPRLIPEERLPPYAFVPGRFPHPESDPAGHSFGVDRGAAEPLDPDRWQASRPYLYGFDLFNNGFYWESHVTWESLWLAAHRKGPVADFLKGLIRLAAAGVKHAEGRPRGVASHAARAAELWQQVGRALGSEKTPFAGFLLTSLIALAEAIGREGWPETPPLLLPAARLG